MLDASAIEARCTHCELPCGRPAEGDEPRFCCLGCAVAHRLLAAGGGGAAAMAQLRLGLGIFLTLNVMAAGWVSYSRDLFGSDLGFGQDAVVELSATVAMFLSTVVVALLGVPLLSNCFAELVPLRRRGHRRPALSAQALIVVAVFAAYLVSLVHWVRGEGHLYFDTAAVLLVVVTLGGAIEGAARRRATESAHRVLSDLPATVRVERQGEWVDLERSELTPGDRVEVRPGEVVPADGRVVVGASSIDEASFTGEAAARTVREGDAVLAGSQNLAGRLRVEVEEAGDDTVLAQMEQALAAARRTRPEVQRLADRVAAVFVPAVVLLALGVLLHRTALGAPGEGLVRALTVLLISCPCALGLAAPLAAWSGLRRAAQRGILVDSAATLERAAEVDAILLDKTGTLTEPGVDLERVYLAPGVDRDWALAAAVALESASRHPVARAFVAACADLSVEPLTATDVRENPGFGIEGTVGSQRLFFGAANRVLDLGVRADGWQVDGSQLVLAGGGRVLAAFRVEERLRRRARTAVDRLRAAGLDVSILSGDEPTRVDRVASALGVRGFPRRLPLDKVEHLERERAGGCTVAMVGDGINDSLVLAAADIGISVGSASDLAARSGNVRLATDRLDRIPLLLELARDVRRRIAANLLFAFGFNAMGIGLALIGRLTPVVAALAMVLSSVAVVRISSGAGRSVVAAGREPARSRPGAADGLAAAPGAST